MKKFRKDFYNLEAAQIQNQLIINNKLSLSELIKKQYNSNGGPTDVKT